MLRKLRSSVTLVRIRLALYFLPVLALALVPVLALAQAATSKAPQVDVVAIVNALPLPAGVKVAIMFGFPLFYAACAFLRPFVGPQTIVGRAIRVVLDGVKHPDEVQHTSQGLAVSPAQAAHDDAGA